MIATEMKVIITQLSAEQHKHKKSSDMINGGVHTHEGHLTKSDSGFTFQKQFYSNQNSFAS